VNGPKVTSSDITIQIRPFSQNFKQAQSQAGGGGGGGAAVAAAGRARSSSGRSSPPRST
jgi:hypothetical protein